MRYHFEKSRNTVANTLLAAAYTAATIALAALAYQEFRAGELLPAVGFALGAVACTTGAVSPMGTTMPAQIEKEANESILEIHPGVSVVGRNQRGRRTDQRPATPADRKSVDRGDRHHGRRHIPGVGQS